VIGVPAGEPTGTEVIEAVPCTSDTSSAPAAGAGRLVETMTGGLLTYTTIAQVERARGAQVG
jgi:hypothetical protein